MADAPLFFELILWFVLGMIFAVSAAAIFLIVIAAVLTVLTSIFGWGGDPLKESSRETG